MRDQKRRAPPKTELERRLLVRKILDLHSAGASPRAVAIRLGVPLRTVNNVVGDARRERDARALSSTTAAVARAEQYPAAAGPGQVDALLGGFTSVRLDALADRLGLAEDRALALCCERHLRVVARGGVAWVQGRERRATVAASGRP